jgi:hypothetical protein
MLFHHSGCRFPPPESGIINDASGFEKAGNRSSATCPTDLFDWYNTPLGSCYFDLSALSPDALLTMSSNHHFKVGGLYNRSVIPHVDFLLSLRLSK